MPVFSLLNDFSSKCPAMTNGGRMLSRGIIAASCGFTLGLIGLIAGYRHYFAIAEAARFAEAEGTAKGGVDEEAATKEGEEGPAVQGEAKDMPQASA